jgi:monofunctional biosynthetic peptidoglycan transglycosylase
VSVNSSFVRSFVGLFRSVSHVFAIIGIAITAAVAWFIPWVFTLHLGVLIYFPYQPKSEQRYMRVTGPLAWTHKKNWVPAAEIPKSCKLALVAAEDTKFFIHHGIDFESLEKSYEYNQRKKKNKRGGSTITQQLIKNAFLSRERSYIRKAREIVGAVLLDATSTKDMQLNWYFNIVEFGPNIYGIKDAAQFYFKKSPSALTQRECASLVAILPSPNKWNKSLKAGAPSGFLAARVGTIVARMSMIPTEDDLIASSKPVAARGDKKKASKPVDPASMNKSELPAPPDLPGMDENLQKAEIQAEKADQLDLPEEIGEGEWGSYELGKDSWEMDKSSNKPQPSENTEAGEP